MHLSGCPVVTYEYVGHLMFSLHIECCTFLGIDLNFHLELSVWHSRLWSLFVVMHQDMLAHCNACHLFFHHGLYSESACVNCSVYSSCNPLFASWSAFTLLSIAVWVGIQLIVSASYCLVCSQLSKSMCEL